MVKLEATMSDWFYNSLLGKEVLTINRKYFKLRKPLERRLYELARKHCGTQGEFKIGLEKLHKKTGSTSPLKKFRYYLRKIIKTNHLPDYQLFLADNDVVHFSYTPDDNTKARSLMDKVGSKAELEVDGGIKVSNIGEMARSGADAFVAGSAIYGSDDYAKTIGAMREEIKAK